MIRVSRIEPSFKKNQDNSLATITIAQKTILKAMMKIKTIGFLAGGTFIRVPSLVLDISIEYFI